LCYNLFAPLGQEGSIAMQKRIRVTLETGLTQDNVLDFKDDDEFLQWASEVMTNLTKYTAGWFILDGP